MESAGQSRENKYQMGVFTQPVPEADTRSMEVRGDLRPLADRLLSLLYRTSNLLFL
jgi:hypothetical protein